MFRLAAGCIEEYFVILNQVYKRIILVWLLIMGMETIQGILRTILLAPLVGDFQARQIAVLTGSGIIFLVTWLTIRWIGVSKSWQLLVVGLVWVVLTILFEVVLGRWILSLPWERIFEDYDVSNGGFLGLGLLFMLLSPMLASRLRKR
jgi:hypothetical protein